MRSERQVPAAAPQSRTSRLIEWQKRAAFFSSISASAVLVIIVFRVLIKALDETPESVEKTAPTSSPKLPHNLLRSANTTLDPCTNFFDYACYNRHTIQSTTSLEADIQQPAIQGRLRSPAGQAIFGFYRSCLSGTADPASIVNQAVQAVVDLTRHYDPSDPRAALRLLLTLSLFYSLSAPMQVTILPLGVQPPTLSIVTHSSTVQSYIARFYSEHGYEALRVLNEMAVTNVTLDELNDARGRVVVDEHCSSYDSLPNVTTFLIPGLGESDWKLIVSELYPWPLPNFTCHSKLSVLRQNIAVLLTDTAINKETRVALLTIHAVGSLTAGHLESARNIRERFRFCSHRTSLLGFFWIEVTAQELTNPEQDAIVRNIFRSILKAVIDDATELPHGSDSDNVRDKMAAIRLLLAKDFVSDKVAIPDLVANTFRNELAIKRYQRCVQRSHVSLGVTYFDRLKSLFSSPIYFVGPYVLMIPPQDYLVLHSDSTDDFGINAATFELLIARKLWSRLLDEWKWSDTSREAYIRQLDCVWSDPKRDTQKWVLFRLALSSVLRVKKKRTEWHEKVYDWSVTRLSRSQIFYMNIFFTEYCKEKKPKDVIPRNAILRNFRDFREAFKCPKPESSCFEF